MLTRLGWDEAAAACDAHGRPCKADGGCCSGLCKRNGPCATGGKLTGACRCRCPAGSKPCGTKRCCGTGQECQGGRCVAACVPACGDRVCGDDGCGNPCGSCASGEDCVGGTCVGGAGTCTEGLDACDPGPSIRCNSGGLCRCVQQVGGGLFCAGDGAGCSLCATDAECVASLGPGSACVVCDGCTEIADAACVPPCPFSP